MELSLFRDHTDVQLLKIDLGSFLEPCAWCLKLGERGFGRQGYATTKIWSFSSLWVVPSGFLSLQGLS